MLSSGRLLGINIDQNAIRNLIKDLRKIYKNRSQIDQKSEPGRLLELIRPSWSCLGMSCRVFARLETSWGRLGKRPGCVLGRPGCVLGRPGGVFRGVGASLGASWGVPGSSWA